MNNPLVFDPTRRYDQADNFFKPRGLWVSHEPEVDSWGWKDWCLSESFRDVSHRSIVTVKSGGILLIETVSALLDFAQEFRIILPRYAIDDRIDWPRVVAAYSGIIIAPYQWSVRNEQMWYYPWDCASGCIWNLDAIESVVADTKYVAPKV